MAASDRKWQIDTDPFFVEDEEQLSEALFEATRLLNRIGGAIVIAAHREEVAPDHYETVAFGFKWTSYAPAKRLAKDEPVSEPVPEEVAA